MSFIRQAAFLVALTLAPISWCQAQESKDAKDAPPAPAATTPAPAATTPEAAPAAAPAGPTNAELKVMVDTLWVMLGGMLVFFMNLGFGCVESGFCRAKNCVNIISKNFVVFAVSSIGFWLIGWGLMFGDGNDYIGQKGLWMVSGADNSPATLTEYKGDYGAINWTGVPLTAKFFFQLVFAGTAATIVSGAVAERIKYHSFIVFSFIITMFIYPIVGHWIWGGGFLAKAGFLDFAGCTQVHSIGGWSALAGIIVLGPRIGKYSPDGKTQAIPGHNMTAAFIGCLVLWLGWFGFNPGSTMAADPKLIGHIAITTNMSAAAATLSSTVVAWVLLGKPDIGMTLNGCLAGLVGITSACAWVTTIDSVIIGTIAGAIVVPSVMFFDKIKIDDPVGATSVHLVCGVFGTLCVGLFADKELIGALGTAGLFHGGGTEQLIKQLKGIAATAAFVFPVALISFLIINAIFGLRVKKEEEIEGLDVGEHGNEAYHGFVMTS